jgi:hypothetical protein
MPAERCAHCRQIARCAPAPLLPVCLDCTRALVSYFARTPESVDAVRIRQVERAHKHDRAPWRAGQWRAWRAAGKDA